MNQAKARYSYDQVPYPNLSHASTHPDLLATLAHLVGMHPAPVDCCRVLELGCGAGANLIPMACALPDSQFTGIDLAGRQIEDGRQMVTSLGLKNITLLSMNILDVTPDLGQFDYILTHGVFSWVPPAVQDKILGISRENLAPQGIAYISYNTYPGWHMINIARGIMRFYTRDIPDLEERAAKARSILEWFASAGETDTNGYYGYLRMYADFLAGKPEGDTPKDDSALLHDELEDLNIPFYFHEFFERIAAHQLQYMGDADHANGGKRIAEQLEHLRKTYPSQLEMEQSYDFLKNRTFRKSLLCHQEVVLDRRVTPGRIAGLYISSSANAVSDQPDIAGKTIEQFRTVNGATFSTDHPLSKAAMMCLADAWPKPIQFEALHQQALTLLADEQTQTGNLPDPIPASPTVLEREKKALAANLLKAYDYNPVLVELHSADLSLLNLPTERPTVTPWALLQAQGQNWVTNLRHERVQLDDFERFLLLHLDGSKDVPSLVEIFMEGPIASGDLTLDSESKPLNQDEMRVLLTKDINHRLIWLAKAALMTNASRSGGESYG